MKKIDFGKLFRSKTLWLGVGGVVLLAVIWGAILTLPAQVEVTALSLNGAEVEPDTAFLLTTQRKLTEEELRAKLVLTPELPYTLKAQEDGSYILTPARPLEAGTQLLVRFGGKSFTFQVTKSLLVTSFLPMNGSTGVPVHTGIEFRFNQENLAMADFKAAVSISPEVPMEVSQGDGNFVLYPSTALDYSTDYTVTLKAPLATPSGFALRETLRFSFTTLSKMAEATDHLFDLGFQNSLNVFPDEAPQMLVYLDDAVPRPARIAVDIYRYGQADSYKGELESSLRQSRYGKGGYSSKSFTGENTTKYASFEAEPFRAIEEEQSYSNQYVLPFPQALPAGQYLVELSLPTGEVENGKPYVIKRQMLMQSSELSTFFMQTEDDLLLWVNDTATGEPVQDAAFQLAGDITATGTTGADGTALITSPGMSVKGQDNVGVFTLTAGNRVFMDASYFAPPDENPAKNYVSYLFTDRPIYRTTDTVQVWGMVRPRGTATPAPTELLLQMDSDEGIPVKPDARGLFTATLPLKNRTSSWSNLFLVLGEERIGGGAAFRVEDYVKPVYTATSAPTKPFFFLPGGDLPAIGLEVALFDGTPVPGFSVGVESWSGATFGWQGAQLATDEKGHLQVSANVPNTVNSWYPRSYQYRFSSKAAEAENCYSTGYFYVIHRDLMLSGKPTLVGDRMEVTLSTNRVDVSRAKTTDDLWTADALKGVATSTPVTAQLVATRYNKIQTGTAYDFINQVSSPTYRYEQVETVEKNYSFTTQQGRYTLKDLPRSDREVCYHLNFSAQDSQGQPVEYSVYLAPPYPRNSWGNSDYRYSLAKKLTDTELQGVESADGFSYDLWGMSRRFTDNEAVTFQLQRNEQPVEKMTGRILYSTVQTGIKAPTVSTDAEFTLPYSEELLPNYVITGAYFDGKHVFYLESSYMNFNPEKRELDIRLAGDKERYKPAEQVQLSATVTSKETGKPAANADLVLAVVDEAIFAIQEQSLDLLGGIYHAVYSPNIAKYASYAPPQYGGAGEKGGGGGGDDARSELKDTAYFATGKTDGQGKATFRFTMPDNITSWRASALALTENNQAGSATKNLIATKPFFVTPVLNETILLGDSFAVGLRGAGTAVGEQDAVHYTVTVEGPGGKQTDTTDSPLREYAPLLFTAPAVGSYTVTVEGSCRGLTDTVRLPFTVVPAGVEVTRVKTFELAQGIQIAPLRYPVTITLYDKNTETYNRVLRSVIGDSFGQRADMRIARKYAAQIMEERGQSWWYIRSKDEDISDLAYAYLGIFPYTPKDMDLTAQLHLALPKMLHNETLSYVRVQDTDKMEGRLSSYYLSQMLAKAMTLEALEAVIQSGSDYDLVDKLNYAAARAVGGDLQTAKAQYEALVTPKLQKLTGLDGEEVLYLPADGTASEGDCTAAAFRLATLLEHKDAEPLVLYLVQKKSQYQPYLAEQLLFLDRYTPKAGQTGKFSYTQNGKTETVTLDTNGKQLTMDESQLAKASFKVLSGQVYADVYYTGAPQDTADPAQKKLSITKTITPLEGTIATGKLVQITLTPNVSGLDQDIGDVELVIDDYIPSGMKFERYGATHHPEGWQGWYLSSRQGQRLRFTAYGSSILQPIVYYARCSAPGDYVVESAFIASASAPVWGFSTRDMVQIAK